MTQSLFLFPVHRNSNNVFPSHLCCKRKNLCISGQIRCKSDPNALFLVALFLVDYLSRSSGSWSREPFIFLLVIGFVNP
uniref:Uncharacterized protein n=1 Tax=Picea glauca TaxID=3330 RepID=A0A101M465_PICGL|nr:hypothetical protein ABT39_MTgene418 [Picea glauca]QHR91284.1 hypothetical protein Q903MT_gene5316 [Picea sitchensis]